VIKASERPFELDDVERYACLPQIQALFCRERHAASGSRTRVWLFATQAMGLLAGYRLGDAVLAVSALGPLNLRKVSGAATRFLHGI
jgi:hypothetical protein